MAELRFSQAERRNFALPILIAAALAGMALGLFYWLTPHRIAELSVPRVSLLPEHIVYPGHSMTVGAQDQAEDDLYVVARVRVHDTLKLPLFINGLTGTLTTADGAQVTVSAVQTRDLAGLCISFPRLRDLTGTLLAREAEIAPGAVVEGDVVLDFPVTQAMWDARQSATVTLDTYHQGQLTVTIPK